MILKEAKHVVASRYKELSVSKLWPYVKEISEMIQYFPKIKEKEPPERDYMWVIISTINSEATIKIVKDVRKNLRSEDVVNQNQLVEEDPVLYKEISEIVAQKGNAKQLQSSFILINIVHRGRVPYLLKKSTKLTRNRQPSKQYNIDFGNIGPRHREGSRESIERALRGLDEHVVHRPIQPLKWRKKKKRGRKVNHFEDRSPQDEIRLHQSNFYHKKLKRYSGLAYRLLSLRLQGLSICYNSGLHESWLRANF